MLPVLIIHLLEMRASSSADSRKLHLNRYNLCMMFLQELGDIYWHASFYHEFFELAASANNRVTPAVNPVRDPLIEFLENRSSTRRGYGQVATAPQSLGNSNFPSTGQIISHSSSNLNTNGVPEVLNDTFPLNPSRPNGESQESAELGHDSGQALPQVESISNFTFDQTNNLDVRFEEWLVGYDQFQNIFPSA